MSRLPRAGFGLWVLGSSVALVGMPFFAGEEAVGGAHYNKELKKIVKTEYDNKIKITCAACHPPPSDPRVMELKAAGKIETSKEVRSVFGRIVEEATKFKPEQSAALSVPGPKRTEEQNKLVKEATVQLHTGIKKALEQQSQVHDKTFGDLIKAGERPDSKVVGKK